MVDFAPAMADALRAKGNLSRGERAVLKLLDGPDSAVKRWVCDRLEAHARVTLGVSATAAIDWSKIDWNKVLDFLTKLVALLIALAPLFAKKAPKKKR